MLQLLKIILHFHLTLQKRFKFCHFIKTFKERRGTVRSLEVKMTYLSQILTVLAIVYISRNLGLDLDLDLRSIYQNAEEKVEAKLSDIKYERKAPSYHSRRKGNH